MKKFTTQEIRVLFNRVMIGDISFPEMVEIMNERVSEEEKAIFENGDFLRTRDGGLFIFKWFDLLDFNEDPVAFGHFFTGTSGYNTLCDNPMGVCPRSSIDGFCTLDEREKVLSDLASMGKRWNAEKLCIEDIPEELKEGDLAIFWDNEKKIAVIKSYDRSIGSEDDYFLHKDQNGFRWRNAIKFESKEQFERLIKGEI